MTWLVQWTVAAAAVGAAAVGVVAMIAFPRGKHRAHNTGTGPRIVKPPQLPPFASGGRASGNGIPVVVAAAAAVVGVAGVPLPRDAVVPRHSIVPRRRLEKPCRRKHRRFRAVCRRALPDNVSRRRPLRRNCTDRRLVTYSNDDTAAAAAAVVADVVVRLDDDEFLLEIDVQFLNRGRIGLRTTWYYSAGDYNGGDCSLFRQVFFFFFLFLLQD